jgi:hypothetical protein
MHQRELTMPKAGRGVKNATGYGREIVKSKFK